VRTCIGTWITIACVIYSRRVIHQIDMLRDPKLADTRRHIVIVSILVTIGQVVGYGSTGFFVWIPWVRNYSAYTMPAFLGFANLIAALARFIFGSHRHHTSAVTAAAPTKQQSFRNGGGNTTPLQSPPHSPFPVSSPTSPPHLQRVITYKVVPRQHSSAGLALHHPQQLLHHNHSHVQLQQPQQPHSNTSSVSPITSPSSQPQRTLSTKTIATTVITNNASLVS
jgi:hypothetical protein